MKINPFDKLRINAKRNRSIKNLNSFLLLLLIIVIGAFFRFYGINWDQNHHLHPDERFLTMVGNAMKAPSTLLDYFNPQISTFSPANVGFPFFVYGVFPLTLNKILALLLNTDTYNDFTLQGRFLSGVFDLLVVFLVYKTTELFERQYRLHPSIKYLASFFYAIAVLPIQLSHFFAVDTFFNTFMFTSFYFALRFSMSPRHSEAKSPTIFWLIASAIFFGLALASKVSTVFILPLNAFFLLFSQGRSLIKDRPSHILHKITAAALLMLLYILVSYFTVRLVDPYLFEHPNFFNPQISTVFLQNIKALKSFEGKDIWYPPAVQWIHKPSLVFSLVQLAVFGVGFPYFFCIVLGCVAIVKRMKSVPLLIILVWTAGFFLYQSTQFVKAMRYFVFLYPFLALYAGIGFYSFVKGWSRFSRTFAIVVILLWPFMFLSIYSKPHSRVEASEWIYKNVPDKSVILGEHWDDPLPLPVRKTQGKRFAVEILSVFDPDTSQKWQSINTLLNSADYYILSSNRGWGSIPTVPEKYPLMSKFYQDLFAGRLPYKKIKDFTSYPSLTYIGIPIEFPDDWTDESFTVYDHPRVIIFARTTKR